jgi:hypothetical protein
MPNETPKCPECGSPTLDRKSAILLAQAQDWVADSRFCAVCREWRRDDRARSTYLGFAVAADDG